MVEDEEKVEEKETKEVKNGFELVEVVTQTAKVVVYNGKEIDIQELLVALAKHSSKQTGFKFE